MVSSLTPLSLRYFRNFSSILTQRLDWVSTEHAWNKFKTNVLQLILKRPYMIFRQKTFQLWEGFVPGPNEGSAPCPHLWLFPESACV